MRLSDTLVKYTGIINFEPELLTKKHELQSEWKRNAYIALGGDICEYYAWFIKKRFRLELIKPLREPHITFIADRFTDLKGKSEVAKQRRWLKVKKHWHGKSVDVVLNTNIHSNGKHWWLNVDHAYRDDIHAIRNELGLDRPFAGLHMTIGHVNEQNRPHSDYINRLHELGIITLNKY